MSDQDLMELSTKKADAAKERIGLASTIAKLELQNSSLKRENDRLWLESLALWVKSVELGITGELVREVKKIEGKRLKEEVFPPKLEIHQTPGLNRIAQLEWDNLFLERTNVGFRARHTFLRPEIQKAEIKNNVEKRFKEIDEKYKHFPPDREIGSELKRIANFLSK